MKKSLYSVVFVTTALLSTNSYAEFSTSMNCDIDLKNNLAITPQHILIKDDEETLIDIYQDKMVFVRGDVVQLNEVQQKLVSDYSLALRSAVPEMGEIAVEAIDVAFSGLAAGFQHIRNNQDIIDRFDNLKAKLKTKYHDKEGYFSFSNGEFRQNIGGNSIDDEINDLVEDIMPSIVGSIVSNIGEAIAGNDDILEDLDDLDERIENEVDRKSTKLENKANSFCLKLKEADLLEGNLVASSRKLKDFDLIDINYDESHD